MQYSTRRLVQGCVCALLTCLTGCQHLVQLHLEHAQSYAFDEVTYAKLSKAFGVKKRIACPAKAECVPYLFAPARHTSEQLNSEIDMDFTGQPFRASLHVNRDQVPALAGNIILLHGYRGSKEWMLTTASYFQFLGFNVYIPDLSGHGDAPKPKGFGVNDGDYLATLLKYELDPKLPVILVGNSMGALPALSLVQPTQAKGLILLAPMLPFDDAIVAYTQHRPTWYSKWIPEEALRQGALNAMADVNVTPEQTDIIPKLASIDIPTLIFASETDPVAPYANWDGLSHLDQQGMLKVVSVGDREHAYMAAIDQAQHPVILNWLTQTLSVSTPSSE